MPPKMVKGRGRKLFKTGALIFSWICMGLYSEVSSPTLPVLKARIGVNYEEVSRALVARSVGFLLGSLFAGFIGSKWKRLTDFWIALALFMAGGAVIAAPWCPNLALLAAMFFLDGMGKGIQCVCTSSAVMDLWKEKAAVPTLSLHFSFGIGALIAPQVARPFLPQKSHSQPHTIATNIEFLNSTMTVYNGTSLNSTYTHDDNSTGIEGDRIEIAYGLMGGITLLCASVFVYFFFSNPSSEEQEEGTTKRKEKISTKDYCAMLCLTIRKYFSGKILILYIILLIFWSLPVGAERAFGKFLFSFAVESDIQMSLRTATMVETTFWAAFTAGRGLATLAAIFTPPRILLACIILVKVITVVLLAIFGNNNATALWILSAILGATISPVFPTCLVWTNTYIHMTAAMNAYAFLSSAFGAFVFSWLAGYLFEYKGPIYLLYMMLGYALSTLVIFLVTLLYFRYSGMKKINHSELAQPAELENLKSNPKS